jgi:hypothetical protein
MVAAPEMKIREKEPKDQSWIKQLLNERRGFRVVALHPGAVDESRKIKQSSSAIREYGIPIRDEIELERPV